VVVGEGEVRVGVFDSSGKMSVVNSSMGIDGGQAWKNVVAGNDSSFEAIHTSNRDSDVSAIESQRSSLHKKMSQSWKEGEL